MEKLGFACTRRNCGVSLIFFFFLLMFLTHVYGKASIVLESSFEIEILMGLHVFRSPDSEITFLAVGLCVRVCLHNSKISYRRKSKFVILDLYLLEILETSCEGRATKSSSEICI